LTVQKLKRAAVCFLLTAAILFIPNARPASAASIASLQKQQAALTEKEKANAAKLKSLKADKAKKEEYKSTLEAQIDTVQSQIDVLNKQVRALDENIADKESQIAAKQAEIDSDYDQLKKRLHAIYLTGEASTLEIIFHSKDIMDLSNKIEVIRAISTHDANLINSLKSELQSVQSQKAEIEANRKNISQDRAALDTKKSEVNSLLSETNTVIAELAKDEASAEDEGEKIAAERSKINAAIDQWYEDYYSSGKSTGGSGGYVSKGDFTWPVPGVYNITSGYGWRNIGYGNEFHKGIDIASAGVFGKPIVAADSGRVIMAGYGNYGTGYGGYGNVVVIDHGGGLSTLYGHCSKVAVRAGTNVKKGQVIAYVGSSGQATGPHLHFEIRVNGAAKNPMNWFK